MMERRGRRTLLGGRGNVCERPVHKGGSFQSYPWAVRAAKRSYYWPGPWTNRDSDSRGFSRGSIHTGGLNDLLALFMYKFANQPDTGFN